MSVLSKLYECSFCRDRLDVVPVSSLRFSDKLLAMIGIRQYMCPHCFAGYQRVWMPALFRRSGVSSSVVSIAAPSQHQMNPSASKSTTVGTGPDCEMLAK